MTRSGPPIANCLPSVFPVLFWIICVFPGAPAAADGSGVSVKRAYVDGPFGQIHLRHAVGEVPGDGVPLVLFHPTAMSGNYYRIFIPEIGQFRPVIALDTPGYGESDPPPEPATIESLAAALIVALEALGFEGKSTRIDVLGVHTGTLVAAEVALQRPDLVRRVILSGIPLFEGKERQERRTQLVENYATLDKHDASHIQRFWDNTVERRREGMSFERAAEHAYDQYRSGQRFWWAFLGVMNYDTASKLASLQQPVLILNIHDNLQSHNRRSQELIPHARLVDLPELGRDPFDLHAEQLTKIINAFSGIGN